MSGVQRLLYEEVEPFIEYDEKTYEQKLVDSATSDIKEKFNLYQKIVDHGTEEELEESERILNYLEELYKH